MKIGFIGHGRHAQSNLYPSLKFLGIPIQAIATTSKETAEQAKSTQNSKACYSNYKEMFDQEHLDCVFVSVSGESHPQIVKDALNAGLHVFVEKPLSLTLKESKEIHELSQKTGNFVQVGYMKRHAVPYQKIQELLNRIGIITSINATFGCRNFAKDASDYLLQGAIHTINLVQSYAGDILEMDTIMSEVGNNFTVLSIVKGSKNIPVSLTLIAADAWTKLNEELILTGTDGFIKYNNNSGLELHINNESKSLKPRWQEMDEITNLYTTVSTTGSGSFQDLYQKGFIPEISNFLECVKYSRSPITDSLDNLKTMEWVEKLLK